MVLHLCEKLAISILFIARECIEFICYQYYQAIWGTISNTLPFWKKNGNTVPRWIGKYAPLRNVHPSALEIASGGIFSNTSFLSALYYYNIQTVYFLKFNKVCRKNWSENTVIARGGGGSDHAKTIFGFNSWSDKRIWKNMHFCRKIHQSAKDRFGGGYTNIGNNIHFNFYRNPSLVSFGVVMSCHGL